MSTRRYCDVGLSLSDALTGVALSWILMVPLSTVVALGLVGFLTGTAYAVIVSALLTIAIYRTKAGTLTPADWVTLVRATLVGAVAAMVADSFDHPMPPTMIVALATAALILDGVDGHVARRTGTESRLGARFDLEIDASMVLVLSIYVAQFLGVWVIAMGLLRYVFLGAARVIPWLRGDLPPRYDRKVIGVAQTVALIVAAVPSVPVGLAVVLVGTTLLVVVGSFGRDIFLLHRLHRLHHGHSHHRELPTPP